MNELFIVLAILVGIIIIGAILDYLFSDERCRACRANDWDVHRDYHKRICRQCGYQERIW
jgi:hypothetical protein